MTAEKDRERLSFGDELEDLDNSTWPNPTKGRPRPEAIKKAAEATGFSSREPAASARSQKQRRRRTGRNAQFNLKTTPETIEMFTQIADAQGWGLGEAFEMATALLKRETTKSSE